MLNAIARRVRVQKGLVRQPVPERPPFPSVDTKPAKAYGHNARTPDGRVILTEEQLSGFIPEYGPHSMMSFVEDAYDAEGNKVKVLSKEREALQDEWVDMMVRGIKPNPSGKKSYIFIGGGTASGKSTVTKRMDDYPKVRELDDINTKPPGEAVLLDADAIKVRAPEWAGHDERTRANFMHEESSLVVKLASAVAMERGLDIVLDGTGDGSSHGMAKKVDKVLASGYPARGLYITVPAGEAVIRSFERGIETGRFVADNTLLKIHRDVSSTYEGMHQKFTRYDLFDTDVPFGAPGIPIVVDGQIVDEVRYRAFLDKKNVTNLQAMQEALRRAEAKTYRKVTAADGSKWPPERVKEETIKHIQEKIAIYSAKALAA
jgi:thymidylate kinase